MRYHRRKRSRQDRVLMVFWDTLMEMSTSSVQLEV